MRLKGKKAIVTGGARSIGQAIAVRLAEEGADVVINYCANAEGADSTTKKIEALGRSALAIKVDFTDHEGPERFLNEATAFLGQVDCLVNNAAIADRTPFLDLPLETFEQLMRVNLTTPMLLTQAVARQMVARDHPGSIVNISSISGRSGYKNLVAYSTSKAALNMLTKNTALELAQYKIRVNGIAPGVIQAGMNQDTPHKKPELWRERMARIPLARAGMPEEFTGAAVFLLSDESSWMTGDTITIDGGHSLSY